MRIRSRRSLSKISRIEKRSRLPFLLKNCEYSRLTAQKKKRKLPT
jgi:hypothetical protein